MWSRKRLRRKWNPARNWVILIFSRQKPCTRIILSILHSFSHFLTAIVLSVITPKKISFGNPRKQMSNFTKWYLYKWIFRILSVFFTFLVKYDINFLSLPWEIVFGVITDNSLYLSLLKSVKKKCDIVPLCPLEIITYSVS